MVKTIKELADELNVSKDKVKYQVRKLPSEFTSKENGITYITSAGIEVIKGNIVGKTPYSKTSESPNDYLVNQLAFFQKELEKKKAQELAAKAKVEEFQYFVQLGVFSSVENANILVKQAGAGFIVVKSSVNDKQYVVRSKPGKKSDMEALSAKVKNLGLTPIVRVW